MFSAADQSVPLAVLHGDGPGGDHYRVVRHQHAFTSQEGPAVPRVRCGQGDLPPAPRLPHPPASAHLPLRDVSLQVSVVTNSKIRPKPKFLIFRFSKTRQRHLFNKYKFLI